VYNITEAGHKDIQSIRGNVFDLVTYLNENEIFHSLAHPLYSVNGKLSVDHFEKCLLLFRNFEINGARNEEQNSVLVHVLDRLTPALIDMLSEKHELEPPHEYPWQKRFTSGSDDHSSLTIAFRYTEVPHAGTVEEFFQGLQSWKGFVRGETSHPKTLAHNIYSIAYQYYGRKFDLHKYMRSDVIFQLLDRFLQIHQHQAEQRLMARIHFLWGPRKRAKSAENGSNGLLGLLRDEAHRLIQKDPELTAILKNGNGDGGHGTLNQEWFRFVNTISNRLFFHFSDHIVESLTGAHFLNLFQSIGAAAALYSISAPYFLAYSVFNKDRQFARRIHDTFGQGEYPKSAEVNVGHFTDTFYEVNGVSRTLRQQIDAARVSQKKYTVITCDGRDHLAAYGIQNFRPIGEYELSLYPEQKLCYPPFLEILDYCYEQGFTLLHAATPGPLGLTALGISMIMNVPIIATYHTDLPQYAQYLTGDGTISDLVWRYLVWYYQQMDMILVPSGATANELAEKGIRREKIRLFPRGVDIDRFHPSKAAACDQLPESQSMFRLLYVGRISKEKDLEILAKAFKRLAADIDDSQLIIVGDGPYREEMQRELEGFNCLFTGYVLGDELAALYAACDAFVFPSTTDTFGNVVLEAQASGIPVIVTDQGGPCENIIPGETGLVVNGRCPEALEAAMRVLHGDRQKTSAMGKSARAYVEQRDFQSAFEKAWNLYLSVSPKDGNGKQKDLSLFSPASFFGGVNASAL
jgi:glycosyltransferase involved in cell wall biosynthesis